MNQVKSDDKILRSEVLQHVLSYLILYLGLVIASFLLISLDDMDFGTAVSAVSTCINNIGPGMNRVGPMENFSFLSDFSKMVLSADMLLGRLEISPSWCCSRRRCGGRAFEKNLQQHSTEKRHPVSGVPFFPLTILLNL